MKARLFISQASAQVVARKLTAYKAVNILRRTQRKGCFVETGYVIQTVSKDGSVSYVQD